MEQQSQKGDIEGEGGSGGGVGAEGGGAKQKSEETEAMTQQQADNRAKILHEMKATEEDFDKIKRIAVPTIGSKKAFREEQAQTLPSHDQFRVRDTLITTYWTSGNWSGRKDKLEVWAIDSKITVDTTAVMLGLPRLKRPIMDGEKLLEQSDSLHVTLAYISPAMQPPQLLEDALNYQLESYTKSFVDQNITLSFGQSNCNNMLLITESQADANCDLSS